MGMYRDPNMSSSNKVHTIEKCLGVQAELAEIARQLD